MGNDTLWTTKPTGLGGQDDDGGGEVIQPATSCPPAVQGGPWALECGSMGQTGSAPAPNATCEIRGGHISSDPAPTPAQLVNLRPHPSPTCEFSPFFFLGGGRG